MSPSQTSFPELKNDLLRAAGAGLDPAARAELRLTDPPDESLGHLSLACHAAARLLGQSPVEVAAAIAEKLRAEPAVAAATEAPGFVNVRLSAAVALELVAQPVFRDPPHFGRRAGLEPETWLIEYSGPNTNKPLHIGHLRNTILGAALSAMVELYGHRVLRYNIINDRGIHICKSMVAYRRFGEGKTPEDTGEKGDALVGRMYSLFAARAAEEFTRWANGPGQAELERFVARQRAGIEAAADLKLRRRFLEEQAAAGQALPFQPRKVKAARYPELMAGDLEQRYREWRARNQEACATLERQEGVQRFLKESERTFEAEVSELHAEARDMLRRWEENDPEVRSLWRRMNDWVLAGIRQTYARLGVRFDHEDFESDTYLLGKAQVEELLAKGVARRREDGALVADLPPAAPGEPPLEKVLLRADGTSVYITQDLGTFARRVQRHAPDRLIYVVGSEQELHFEALFALVDRQFPGIRERCAHLSYGMVELPHGKMKSREGEIIEADGFLDDVHAAAAAQVRARSPELEGAELDRRAETIALAAVKYHLLKFSKKSTVTFDVDAALDLNGKTGTYCLYALARIRSILRKLPPGEPDGTREARSPGARVRSDLAEETAAVRPGLLAEEEVALLLLVARLPEFVAQGVADLEPYHVADFVYRLARQFSSYYTATNAEGRTRFPVVGCPDPELQSLRILLIRAVEVALENGLAILGIRTLEEM